MCSTNSSWGKKKVAQGQNVEARYFVGRQNCKSNLKITKVLTENKLNGKLLQNNAGHIREHVMFDEKLMVHLETICI